jgi:hypothetical protein
VLEIEQIKEDIDYLKRDVKALLILDGYSKDAVKVVKRLYKELGFIIKENYGFNEFGKFEKLKELIHGDCCYCKYYSEYKLDENCQKCSRNNIFDDTSNDLSIFKLQKSMA